MIFKTQTGSIYEVDGLSVRRSGQSHDLRQDGEWNTLLSAPQVTLGQPVTFIMAPLSPPQFEGATATIRRTSPVVEVVS